MRTLMLLLQLTTLTKARFSEKKPKTLKTQIEAEMRPCR